ncbi:MAG TPA: restriction endonuclease [Ruminococcus sp.]|nr:restriction endonuclease [Ruminococcus sp.]
MARYFFQETVYHAGLHKYRVVKGETPDEAANKAIALQQQWEAEWARKCEAERKKQFRAAKANREQADIAYAGEMTQKAEQIQRDLDSILLRSLSVEAFDFDSMKDHSDYKIQPPLAPKYDEYPREPLRTDPRFNPAPSLFTKLSKNKMKAFDEQNQSAYESAHDAWMTEARTIDDKNQQKKKSYEERMALWQQEKKLFEEERDSTNQEIDKFRHDVVELRKEAVEQYFSMILNGLQYPFEFERKVLAEYQADCKMLVLDMQFPVIENIPALKSVSYIKTRKEFKNTNHPESYIKKKYESVNYQIVLQVLNCCFNDCLIGTSIESIALNGRVKTVDKTTGQTITPCILSLTESREEFMKLNLSAIDPKAWFKSAKGVSAASLANIAPVAPLVTISKEDKRFIEAHEVADTLDEGTNLAAMDWQEFEHLVRELFEKEFGANGGEVKITQASRDGGVDAVAFDPDPIRGGKIVIQAKRYTNVVGVSAVRDLYGTVVSEGASKGILVTTSHYGNDAYEFAKDKPLTLLNGTNLLYLLEKHGYRAKIDIKEAKELQKT